ncbi:NAD(P)/FAD-dependent oxidoreductase [Aspergillus homomorphus CBS 101889]|uniref:Fructosyl amine:oxygen oxidoreductase n=1 Tax=Aspergillus homomorphus (strain CBS 101889) TaxID=1450537 RepID=A0A395HH15_ASPHC|nr:fructosyl amine:oxygen oxidoreductase [Aspergillus homomorphus CBS 101889]RAL07117.1 fructosyl amine:oxygen oxidoreductase [Aspergillus homomorphus CBS 101889]
MRAQLSQETPGPAVSVHIHIDPLPSTEHNMHHLPILIIGAGTWGASTALHLARRGYTNVTVLDAYAQPSAISAGNDVNKIVSFMQSPADDDPDFANRTFFAALSKGFQHDPVFKPHFHEVGSITSAFSPGGLKHIHRRNRPGDEVIELNTPDDFRRAFPEGILTGPLEGWKGYWKKRGAGWVHARHALLAAITEAQRLGVKFITGDPQGAVVRLLFAFSSSGDVIGAETADGQQHLAHRVILAAGANADRFLDFKKQLRPTAWTLAHIRMTPSEAAAYRNLPVLFNADQGFFMEPDADRHELKICDEHPGYCNWVYDDDDPDRGGQPPERRSIPFARHQIPLESADRIRALLRATMPQLADRPFSFARICWCADTVDRNFLIDYHPDYPSLLLAVGASGRGFAHIPSIGGFIVDRLEGRLDERLAATVRWRPELAVDRDWDDTLNRFGGEYRVMDFNESAGVKG